MFLRINQYIFAVFIFSLLGSLMAAVAFALLLSLAILTHLVQGDDISMVFVMSSYVLTVCFVCNAFAFFFSILWKKVFHFWLPKKENYVFVVTAAFLANLVGVFVLGAIAVYPVVLVATFIAVYFEARLYTNTWRKLAAIKSSPLA